MNQNNNEEPKLITSVWDFNTLGTCFSYSLFWWVSAGCSFLVSLSYRPLTAAAAAGVGLRAHALFNRSRNITCNQRGSLHRSCLCARLPRLLMRLRGDFQLLDCCRDTSSLLSLLQLAQSLPVVLRQVLKQLKRLEKKLKIITCVYPHRGEWTVISCCRVSEHHLHTLSPSSGGAGELTLQPAQYEQSKLAYVNIMKENEA